MNAKTFIKRPIIVLSFIVFVIAIVAAAKFGFVTEAETKAQAPVIVPTITATNVDTLFTDVDGDGRADPGDTILYTVTINNAGTDATNTVFSSTLDANTTLVGSSVNTSPIAANDPGYTAAGNVLITVSAASGVLVNDIDPDTGNNTGLTASAGATSANGGNVAMSANGGFSYNPLPGFTGTDTFTYTVTDAGGATGTGTVTFNVSGMIWFIQTGAPAGGDGRLTNPFNCYTGVGCFSAVAADDPGDNIFLYTGAYTGGNTLLANQRLIGQGAGASLSTITGITPPAGSEFLPSTGGVRPTMTTTIAAVNAINLGSSNTLRGFNIGNTTAADIAGTSFGTLTATEMELNGTGAPLILTTGTLAATFDNLAATSAPGGSGIGLTTVGGTLTVAGTTSITGATDAGIDIVGSSVAANFGTSTTVTSSTNEGIFVNTSTGNISFGNTNISSGFNAVSLSQNSAGTRSFGTITTTNGTDGFLHGFAGGTTTVSGLATFTNPSGNCIDIQDSTTAVTFANVNCTQSGGTGVFFDDNTAGGTVSFADLDISPDSGQRCLHATDGLGTITTTSGTIAPGGTGIPIEIVGLSLVSVQPLNIQFTSVSANGAASGIILTNTSSSGAPGGFRVLGSGGSCTSAGTCTGGAIQNSTSHGIALNNALNVSLTRMAIQTTVGNGVSGTEVTNFTFQNGFIDNSGTGLAAQVSNIAFNTLNANNLDGVVTISNNTLTNAYFHAVAIETYSGTTTSLDISGNTITSATFGGPNSVCVGPHTPTTCSQGNGIHVIAHGSAAVSASINDATVTNNIITNFPIGGGIIMQGTNASVGSPQLTFGIPNDANNIISITGNRIAGQSTGNKMNTNAIQIGINGIARGNWEINNNGTVANPITNIAGNVISTSVLGTSNGTVTINNNRIVANHQPNFGAPFGISAGVGRTFACCTDVATMSIVIDGNNVSATDGNGIKLRGAEAQGTINARISNNTVAAPVATALREGIFVEAGGSTAGTDNDVCVDIVGNTTAGASDGFDTAPGIRLRKQGTSTTVNAFGVEGMAATSTPGVEQYVGNGAGKNPGSANGTFGTNGVVLGSATSGFTNCSAAPITPPVEEAENKTTESSNNNLSFSNMSYESPSEMLATIEPLFKHNNSVEFGAGGNASVNERASSSESGASVENDTLSESGTLLYSRVSAFISALGDAISPTVIAQDNLQDIPVQLSGETITVNGGSPAGFTLPGAKSITITYRATINTPPPYFTQVSNQGSISGSNFLVVILTDDPSVGGAADPTVTPIDSTTVTVSSSQNPSITGQSVTFTATLTGVPSHGAADPSGTVQFFDNAVALGAPQAVVPGVLNDNTATATFTTSSLTAATHPITATYSGGGGYNANGVSNTLNQVVSNTAVWDGSTSTAWADGTNWTTNAAPSLATNDVDLPAAAVNNPTISAADVTVNNVTIGPGRILTINTNRTLTVNGVLTRNGNNIIGGSAGTVAIGATGSVAGSSGHIETNLRKTFGGTGNFDFVVGTANGYSPVQINVTAGTFPLDFTVRAEQTKHPHAIFPVVSSLKRYWIVTPSGGSPTATMTFNWLDPTDIMGTEASYRLARVTGGTPFIYGPLPSIVINPGANSATIAGATIFSDWTLAAVPTAASVSVGGRVVDAVGAAVSNAQLSMVDGDGNVRLARTNPFGYYRFFDIPAGASYTISVNHKLHTFTPQFITVNEAVENLDFMASP